MQTVSLSKFQLYNLVRFLKALPADEVVSLGRDGVKSVIRLENASDDLMLQNKPFEDFYKNVEKRQQEILKQVGEDDAITKNMKASETQKRFEDMEKDLQFNVEKDKELSVELSDEKMGLMKEVFEKAVFRPCFFDSNNHPSCYFLDKGFAVKILTALGIEE